jgi:hypothetical protein
MAESKVLQHDGAIITWKASAGTELLTLTSLATLAGRQGGYHDFGTAARARRFAWRAKIVPGATRVVGEVVRIYFTTGDGTVYDNDDGTGDIAVSSIDKLRNVLQIGAIIIDENAAVPMGASGEFEMSARWGAPIVWNASANSLSATAGDFLFELTEVPDAVQAQA